MKGMNLQEQKKCGILLIAIGAGDVCHRISAR